MKQLVLNSNIGHYALLLREKADLVRTAIWNTEAVETKANDLLALSLITKISLAGKTFVDVGAHIGSVISEVHRNDKSIKIIAIEAIPQKVSKLRKKFPFAEIIECAVGESEGYVSFFINTQQSGYSSLSEPSTSNKQYLEIKTPLKKLDDLVSSNDVDAIKIDVEGAELGVIRGSQRLLSISRPLVMFESATNGGSKLGYGKEDLWKIFNDFNYIIFVPNRLAHNGDGLSLQTFMDSHVYPKRTTNYFAVPMERRIEIRDRARQITGVKVNG